MKRFNRSNLWRRVLPALLALACLFSLSACSRGGEDSDDPADGGGAGAGTGDKSIYYLNFKPEISSVYEEIAAKYKAETGVTVRVVTAAANTYEQTLKSEIAKSDAPTIFQVNGPIGYASWKDYCADMSDTDLYRHLSDQDMAIKSGDGVYGVPYVVEGYGIIYNEAITDKYFALTDRATSFRNMDEIDSFAKLKALVEDMTAKKDALGIAGVFASTSLKPGDDWRWQTHLANVPLYYEFKDDNISLTSGSVPEIKFSYAANYKNIFDLYLDNSVTARTLLGTKQVTDSMSEFALGQCAMVQNGTWAWKEIGEVEGNTIDPEKIKFLPIYIGAPGEEKQGLCVGTENYFAINSKVSEEKQRLSADFLYWLFSSDTGKGYVTGDLGFITPFDTFSDEEKPDDPLAREMLRYLENDDKFNVNWVFPVFPSQTFKDNFGAGLLKYAQGQSDFDTVKNAVIADWKKEAGSGAAG